MTDREITDAFAAMTSTLLEKFAEVRNENQKRFDENQVTATLLARVVRELETQDRILTALRRELALRAQETNR